MEPSVPSEPLNFVKTICCIGAGYVGGPTMAVIAKNCPHLKVIVADKDKRRIDAWNGPSLPIFEPHLKDYVQKYRGKNLFFTTNIAEAIRESEIIFVAVNTPTKEFGFWVHFLFDLPQGGCGYDLSAYEAVSRTIVDSAESSKIIVEKSTVPVRTGERMRNIFECCRRSAEIQLEVISNPEFLAEGSAIENLERPDRILIGGLPTPAGEKAVEALAELYRVWVPEERILRTGLWSAELAKLACNAFLAQRISSINSLSALCERTGADVEELAVVLGTDKRIGPNFLKASVGFGGSCFGKDLLGLIYLCETFQLQPVADYWRQVLKMNDWQKSRFSQMIVQRMFDNVKGKNICILGFAFKKDTGDIRESAAIDVCRFLSSEGANLFIYDPQVPPIAIKEQIPPATISPTAYDAAYESHAIVILTEWDEFRRLDYSQLYCKMAKPAFVFDGRNILDHSSLTQIGFKVYAIGKSYQ